MAALLWTNFNESIGNYLGKLLWSHEVCKGAENGKVIQVMIPWVWNNSTISVIKEMNS